MKIVKYILLLLLLVIIGGAIYVALKDGSFDVSKTRTIKAPTELVYQNVSDFKNWETWGPWMADDPNMKINYPENTVGKGGSYTWESEIMGNGGMTTIEAVENKSLNQEIFFKFPMGESRSDVYWNFAKAEGGATDVTWGMKGEQSFMEKAFMLFQKEPFEAQLEQMYDVGLSNLDSVVTASMSKYSINVNGIKDYGGGYYMYATGACKQSEVSSKMAQMFPMVMSYVMANNLEMAGRPFTLYDEVNSEQGTMIMSVCIPVRERVVTPGGSQVLCGFIEPGKYMNTTLQGNYTNLHEAWQKTTNGLQKEGVEEDKERKPFEIYMTDPTQVTNPADWVTEIYLPIKS